MLRPRRTTRSAWRVVGSFMVIASVVFVSPTAAHARRAPSPYAFEDPVTPGIDVAGTDAGATQNPGVVPPTSSVVNPAGPAGPTASPLLPAVAETDAPGEAVADPVVNPEGTGPGGLAHTGAEGLTSRIGLAMVLVAIGFLAKEASGRRRALAR